MLRDRGRARRGRFCSRRVGRAAGARCDQGARSHRGPFVGAVVLQLPGGAEEWWLVENDEGKPENEIHFCFRLEQWQ